MNNKKSIAEILMEYAISKGATKLHLVTGLWVSKIDEHWLVKCNGHRETIDLVPPFSWSIEYNGWPAGIVGAIDGEGIIAVGEIVNEKTLLEAIQAKMEDKE